MSTVKMSYWNVICHEGQNLTSLKRDD